MKQKENIKGGEWGEWGGGHRKPNRALSREPHSCGAAF